MVLTNGATLPPEQALAKYQGWGLPVTANDVVASRALTYDALREYPSDWVWGFAGPERSDLDAFGVNAVRLDRDPGPYERVDAFVFLSTDGGWPEENQCRLHEALVRPMNSAYWVWVNPS